MQTITLRNCWALLSMGRDWLDTSSPSDNWDCYGCFGLKRKHEASVYLPPTRAEAIPRRDAHDVRLGSMCNVETRECATTMSCQRGFDERALGEPHLEKESAAAVHGSTRPLAGRPSKVNSVDKRADCTTAFVLDVDAARHDRTSTGCGEEMRWRR